MTARKACLVCGGRVLTRGYCAEHLPRRVPGTCSLEGCGRKVKARGWCSAHHHRWLRTGAPEGSLRAPLTERLWARVDYDGPVPPMRPELGPCWLWTGAIGAHGYGVIGKDGGGVVLAHRAAYEDKVGPIPAGLHVDHLCMVRPCIRPEHLEAVTQAENNRRQHLAKRYREAWEARGRGVNVAADLRWLDARRPRTHKTTRARAEGKWGVGPSDLSSCLKAIEFRERPPEGYEPGPVDKAAANVGTMWHEALETAWKRRYPWRRFKVVADVPGLDVPGEADCHDPMTGTVYDWKSCGDWKWERIGKEGPMPAELEQVMLYALALSRAGSLIREVALVYVNRETGSSETFYRPYDEGLALQALGKLVRVMDALDEGRELPRERAGEEMLGPTVNALCARYCPHVRTCWDLPNVPADRTPEGWLYARDDEDGAIQYVLEDYDANRSAESVAKRRKDFDRTLVVGVEPGRYGDWTLAWTGGGLGEPKPDPEARIEQLEAEMTAALVEDRLPRPPEDLPWPTVRRQRNVAIQVKKVRAATLERETRPARAG